MGVGAVQQQRPSGAQQGQRYGSPAGLFPQQPPSWVYGQQAPSWMFNQPPQQATPYFPPTSTGNVAPVAPQSLPPIIGQGYYTLPDGSVTRGGTNGYNGIPQRLPQAPQAPQAPSGIPLGGGATFYPYPSDPNAPIPADAPYTQGPVPGTYRGKGDISNVLLFPGYRSTFVVQQTVVAPYGAWYGCPAYIDVRYAQSAPWPYRNGAAVAAVQPWSDEDAYMAADAARAQALRTALNDLTRFWEGGDIRALRRHLPGTDQDVAVFHNGRFLYSLARNDFAAVSSDVADAVDTVSFRFVNMEKRDDGLIDATARHSYRVRDTGEQRTGTVRYSLLYQNGTYFVSAVALASPGEVGGLPAAK
jgi:hypothetical protein